MGKRKLPFGYRMEMGKTALKLQEAETVQFIFQQYIDGASFRELVHALNGRGVPYITGKLWNKTWLRVFWQMPAMQVRTAIPQL